MKTLLVSLAILLSTALPARAQAVIIPNPVPVVTDACVLVYQASTSNFICTSASAASQPLTDALPLIADNGNTLKRLAFELVGLSAVTRTWTIPDANITIPSTIASLAANTYTGSQVMNGGFTATTGTLSSTLAVSGATTLSSTLGVTGATTLAGLSATTGTFSSTLGVTGAATFASSLAVTGVMNGVTANFVELFTTAPTGSIGLSLKGRSSDNIHSVGFFSNNGVTRYGLLQSTASQITLSYEQGSGSTLTMLSGAVTLSKPLTIGASSSFKTTIDGTDATGAIVATLTDGANLSTQATIAAGRWVTDSSAAFLLQTSPVTAVGVARTWTSRVWITSTGSVGIGTTPSAPLHVMRNDGLSAYFQNTLNTTPSGIYNRFSSAAPNNGSQYFMYNEDSVGVRAVIYSNGGISNYSANNVNLSDRNMKRVSGLVEPLRGKFANIKLYRAQYLDSNRTNDDIMWVADEIAAIDPNWVAPFQEAQEAKPEVLEVKDPVTGEVITPYQPAEPARPFLLGTRDNQIFMAAVAVTQENNRLLNAVLSTLTPAQCLNVATRAGVDVKTLPCAAQ